MRSPRKRVIHIRRKKTSKRKTEIRRSNRGVRKKTKNMDDPRKRMMRGGGDRRWITRVSMDGLDLEDAPDVFKNDKDVVLAAVAQNGLALVDASATLRADKGVVLAAVKQNGLALGDASKELQADKDVVLAAVAQRHSPTLLRNPKYGWGSALQYASKALQNTPKIVLAAVAKNGYALEHASATLRADKGVVSVAVAKDGCALRYASEDLRDNPDIVLAAVKQNGLALGDASEELRGEPDIVLAAVAQNEDALRYASEELQNDECIQFVLNDPKVRQIISQLNYGKMKLLKCVLNDSSIKGDILTLDGQQIVDFVRLFNESSDLEQSKQRLAFGKGDNLRTGIDSPHHKTAEDLLTMVGNAHSDIYSKGDYIKEILKKALNPTCAVCNTSYSPPATE